MTLRHFVWLLAAKGVPLGAGWTDINVLRDAVLMLSESERQIRGDLRVASDGKM